MQKPVSMIQASRASLLDDYVEYKKLTNEDAEAARKAGWSPLHYRPLPSTEPEGLWEFYEEDKDALQVNVEFCLQRDPEYEVMVLKYLDKMEHVFIHGSGAGYITLILQQLEKGVCFYEPNEPCKSFHEWRYRKCFGSSPHYGIGDVTTIPNFYKTLSGQLDFIISFDVLEHVNAPLRTIHNLGRLLTPNGLLLQMPAYWFEHPQHLVRNAWLTHDNILNTMDSLGFDLVETRNHFYVHKPRFNDHEVWKL